MKLFGNAAPPGWFASQVLTVLNNPDSQGEREPLKQFILKNAARFNLTKQELSEDLFRLGGSIRSVQEITDEYDAQMDKLREQLCKAENFVSIHSRVLRADFLDGTDDIQLTLSDREKLLQLNVSERKEELIDALSKAIESFTSLS